MRSKRKVGITLSYVYFVASTIVGIFLSSFIIRTIGKTDYGVYQSMTAFVAYLALLEFGTGTVMSRNLSLLKKDGTDDDDINKNVSTIWTLNSVLIVVICCVAVLFYLLIPTLYSISMTSEQIVMGKHLFVFAVYSLICSFSQQMMNGILIGNEFYIFEKAVSLIRLFVRSILVVSLLLIKPSIYYLVSIDALMSTSILIVSYFFIKKKLKYRFTYSYFDKDIFRLITPLCLAMLLQTIVNTANGSIDKFLISIMMTPEDVTVYSVAMTMFSMFSSIATLPVTMFMPQVAKNIKRGLKGKSLAETLINPCRLNVIITGLIAFGFAVVGKQFLVILYGIGYEPAWHCAMIVMFPMFVNMSNAVIINVLDVMNKRHMRSVILMVTTAANIGMTIVGIKMIGMLGAAIATGISLICQVILLNIFYSKKIGLPIIYLFKEAFKGILSPLIVSCVLAYIITSLFKNAYLQFSVGGLTFLAIFAVLYCSFGANKNEKDMIFRITSKIISK